MTLYNGWKNRQTWNVALWVSNDEPMYRAAVSFMRAYRGRKPYKHFIREMGLQGRFTPDGICWNGARLACVELNRFMRELR